MKSALSGNVQALGMLLAATIAIAISGVHFHITGAMIRPLGEAYGWSRGDIAFALTIAAVIHPFTNVAVGTLADRFNTRAIALPGIAGFAVGTALLGLAAGPVWTWYAANAAMAVLGAGAGNVIFTKLIVEHFDKRRGLALATALAGSGILVSTVPSIVLALQNAVGIRGIYPALGAIFFVITFVPAWLFLPRGTATSRARAPAHESAAGEWRAVVRDGRLWRLALGLMAIAGCVGAFIVHFQPMLADAGLSRAEGARVALLIGPAMIVGRIGTGLLFDLLPTRLVAAVAFALPGVACLWLLAVPLDVGGASLLAVFIGIGMGSEVDVVAYLSSRYFGARDYGLVFAILISGYGFAVATGSWLVGLAYDTAGTYEPALTVLIAGVIAAVALVISIGRPPERDAAVPVPAPAH